MKKITQITTALMILLILPMVSAGSINGADYYDRDTNLWKDFSTIRTINDYNVQVDADTLEGRDLQDIKQIMNRKDRKTLRKAKRYADNRDLDVMDYSDANDVIAIATANAYADSHDSKGSSFNKKDMQNYLFGEEYSTYLDEKYVKPSDFALVVFKNKAYMETLKYQIEHPNVEFHFGQSVNIKTARYVAQYTGVTQIAGRTTCTPKGICVTA